VQQREAARNSALGFPREALKKLRIGEDQVLFLRPHMIEEVQLPICSANLAVTSLPARRFPGCRLYAANDQSILGDRIKFVSPRCPLYANERKEYRLEGLAELVPEPPPDVVFDDGFQVASIGHRDLLTDLNPGEHSKLLERAFLHAGHESGASVAVERCEYPPHKIVGEWETLRV
jgi:hypothetical protein